MKSTPTLFTTPQDHPLIRRIRSSTQEARNRGVRGGLFARRPITFMYFDGRPITFVYSLDIGGA